MMYVNLTPHRVAVLDESGRPIAEWASDGFARLVATETPNEDFSIEGSPLPVRTISYRSITDLPEPVPGTTFIVSQLTALAAPERPDLLFPYDEVRDAKGQIVGCRTLARFETTESKTWLRDEHAE